MNTTYAENIIAELEKKYIKNEEKQLDFIAARLNGVPTDEQEEVIFRCAAYMTLSRTTKVTDWFAEAEAEETRADACFVAMNERDWRDTQQQAKRQRWFGTWDRWVSWARRVDSKRREKAMASRVVKKEVDRIGLLLSERRDVQRYPAAYGSEENCGRLIGDYERMICALPAGKWRLALIKQEESKALQPRIDEIVRQVKLTLSLKETLAAKRIQAAWRSHSTDNDDGNQPPRWKDVVRRSHDDGFDYDYDGEDEGETASQEAERRQEMAEGMERQMEESDIIKRLLDDRQDVFRYPERYATNNAEAVAFICELENTIVRQGGKAQLDKVIAAEEEEEEAAAKGDRYPEFPGLTAFIDSCGEPCRMVMDVMNPEIEALNRAVFEMGSEPTSDPYIRIAHNVSPVVPDNWREIVSRSAEPPPDAPPTPATSRRFTKEWQAFAHSFKDGTN